MPPTPNPPAAAAAPDHEPTPLLSLGTLREWMDALVIAFIFAMFVRTFVFELFKIPSGSMSPTLLGDYVAEGPAEDFEGKTGQYLLIALNQPGGGVQVFRKNDKSGFYQFEGRQPLARIPFSQQVLLDKRGHMEEHRIIVNKFAYWFSGPKRGDIAVFRVPFGMQRAEVERDGLIYEIPNYKRSQGVYVKRAVGLPGEAVSIDSTRNRLLVNGKPLEGQPWEHLQHMAGTRSAGAVYRVGDGETLMFGDNSDNSLDSRYWGPVPNPNFRGKAFMRYWPWKKFGFLSS